MCLGVFVVLQFLEQTRTVSLLVLLNAVHVQDTQQEISGRHRLSIVMDMAAAFELAAESADEEMRHIVMLMLIRVAHIRAVQNQRVIEECTVTVRRVLQLVGQISGRV